MKNEHALYVNKYSKKYFGRSNYAVKDASFVVNKGEFHGFIGANGSGKTTTIKSIIGAYANFEGEIKIYGFKHNDLDAKKIIGYIPEKANFPKGLTLYSYLYYMANLSGLTSKEAKDFANSKIKSFGLQKLRKSSPNSFSSGQKKKVLLAQALVSNPKILIMDEPAANLDPKARFEFFNDLKKLQKSGVTIFISSHILMELDQFVDHITILDNGSVVYNGETASLTKNSNLDYVFKFRTPDDLEKSIKIAKSLKLKYINSNIENNLTVSLLKDENLKKMISNLNKSKVSILEYYEVKNNLQDIYNKFVKVGSIDTPENMKGENNE